MILRIFFAEVGNSFTRGIVIHAPEADFVVTGVFAGFLADLVGHKEITNWKGHKGIRCCLECGNVTYIRKPKAGEVGISCCDSSKFRMRSDEEIWTCIEDLKRGKLTLGIGVFKELEITTGFNHDPHGILFDDGLRSIYKPAHHTIRDWMHTVAQDGLANTHIGYAMHALKDKIGIAPERITDFAGLCNYPSKWGKLDKMAFSPKRLKEKTIKSFASTVLTMIAVFHMFMEKFVASVLPDHFEAFTLLHHIVGIFRMGCEDAMQHVDTLKLLLRKHLAALIKLYGGDDLKPKAHHLFHVIDGMEWLGKLLSCFVTERKHREVKESALHVFRHIEHTTLVDLVNKSFEQVLSGHDLYKATFLIRPAAVDVGGRAFRRSRGAVLRIGRASAEDLCITDDGAVGRIIGFWQCGSSDIYAEIDAYECIDGDARLRSLERSHRMFIDSRTIIDTLIWVMESPAIARISLPPALLHA
jgi:hypothetical protein